MIEILEAMVRKVPEASREALAALAEAIEELAAERVSAEREACAKICDDYSKRAFAGMPMAQEAGVAAANIAKTIRARSK